MAAVQNRPVGIQKAAWLTTVIACLITGVLLLVLGYQGYAASAGVVALSAAINLR